MAKFITIVLSRFRKREETPSWVKERRKVCASCPLNSKNNTSKRTLKQIVYKHLSNFYTWVTRAENEDLGQCECGCSIYFLTAEEDSSCHSKEIGQEDKWKDIKVE